MGEYNLMAATMTLGDTLWDITIASSNIILVNVVFNVRVKGYKAFFVYIFIIGIYLFADKLMFLQNKHDNWYLLYIVAFIMEFIAIILSGYIAHEIYIGILHI